MLYGWNNNHYLGEQIETHHTMEKIGKLADHGFTHKDILHIHEHFSKFADPNKNQVQLYNLYSLIDMEKNEKTNTINYADLLVVKGGLNILLEQVGSDYAQLSKELFDLEFDKQKFMYGKVCESKARRCLCCADFDQKCDYTGDVKKGTVIDFKHLPILSSLRSKINEVSGLPENYLLAEGNHYYDSNQCGDSFSLHYNWYQQGQPIRKHFKITLEPGDIYFMGDKTTGNDWKRRTIPTLRHAAGSEKFTNI